MAKKTTRPGDGSPEPQVRICYERIIPDDLDPERPVRRAMREFMVTSSEKPLKPSDVMQITRMALVNSKKWAPGSKIRCRFLDGSAKMKKKVEEIAHQWEKHASIKLVFVKTGPAEIRISFRADPGSWSAVGRDALNKMNFPSYQPTMNYGWLRDNTGDDEYSRVVLHEFGHALSCIHEHQSPTFNRAWNKEAVMRYFQGPPNYWTPEDIQHNVLGKYSPQAVSATQYDSKSIMLYSFDGALFSDGLGPTNSNKALSAYDIKMIKSMYP
jgi:hypothetical protein